MKSMYGIFSYISHTHLNVGKYTILGLCSDCRRIVFLLAEAIHGVSAEVLHVQISWQAQYLLRNEITVFSST